MHAKGSSWWFQPFSAYCFRSHEPLVALWTKRGLVNWLLRHTAIFCESAPKVRAGGLNRAFGFVVVVVVVVFDFLYQISQYVRSRQQPHRPRQRPRRALTTAVLDLCVLFAMTFLWFAHGKAPRSWWSSRSALEHSRDLSGSAQVGINIMDCSPRYQLQMKVCRDPLQKTYSWWWGASHCIYNLGGGFKCFLISSLLPGDDPIWLTFFRRVETTNQ